MMLAVCLLALVHGTVRSQRPPSGEVHGVTGAVVHTAPDAAAIEDRVILMRAGRIVAASPREAVDVPAGATTLDGKGLFAVAGFQNSHVHFTEFAGHSNAAQIRHKVGDFARAGGQVLFGTLRLGRLVHVDGERRHP